MSKERELLEELSTKDWVSYYYPELINSIKELLAQPEPEPEAWMLIDTETGARIPRAYKPEREVNKDIWKFYPLYAVPTKREPLSLTEIQRIWDENAESGTRENFVRAIEKAHGIGE